MVSIDRHPTTPPFFPFFFWHAGCLISFEVPPGGCQLLLHTFEQSQLRELPRWYKLLRVLPRWYKLLRVLPRCTNYYVYYRGVQTITCTTEVYKLLRVLPRWYKLLRVLPRCTNYYVYCGGGTNYYVYCGGVQTITCTAEVVKMNGYYEK